MPNHYKPIEAQFLEKLLTIEACIAGATEDLDTHPFSEETIAAAMKIVYSDGGDPRLRDKVRDLSESVLIQAARYAVRKKRTNGD
jgi:hypothetical protein